MGGGRLPTALALFAVLLAFSNTVASVEAQDDPIRELTGPPPPGAIVAYGGTTAPTGWLLCDGQEVSRAEHAALFAAIGTTYGEGNGATTFNLPDLRGRMPAGQDRTANRLAANDDLGEAAGEERHQLTQAEMPAHEHGPGDLRSDIGGAHQHALQGRTPIIESGWGTFYVGTHQGPRQLRRDHPRAQRTGDGTRGLDGLGKRA